VISLLRRNLKKVGMNFVIKVEIKNLINQMRVQKPLLTKEIANDFSTKKIHRRINTEIDEHTSSKFYKP
jgi:translation initiation factor 2B subunit (eIF-2B alpha/beta/delta family)